MTITDQELTALYDRYAHIVYRRCASILGTEEDARDAVQETFARVIRHHDEFRGHASPLTWMYRISTNYCLNQLRSRSGRRDTLAQRAHERNGASEGMPLDRERVLALLDGCDDDTRACVVHTYFDECTRQEVAELVGLSVPAVRKRIDEFLARARLAPGVALEGTPGSAS